MRTTVTLDSDTEQMVRQRMAERRVSFKQALNDLVREGRRSADGLRRFSTATRSMGRAKVNLDKALRLAGELEDGDLASGLEAGP
ncbi:MAG: antitoxin [Acidimicrobiaceae bacterium]|nr:antitoxin [Acidimicrobiaceae bacterium]MXZ99518.1 antitoxin [Acidimicrobiaceae bacterium]MYE76242.1 antitoxin [Acidimicrobiaceae bacterium]MYE96543.1 antitoxin [Acidimicrobiaceae bacterium]MYH44546.1 antitoxin [Acidimicrobiaceae bacterium]